MELIYQVSWRPVFKAQSLMGTPDFAALIYDCTSQTMFFLRDGTVAQGPVLIGNVSVGTFSASQAFSESSIRDISRRSVNRFHSVSAPGSNATTFNDKGLLGVGPYVIWPIDQRIIQH